MAGVSAAAHVSPATDVPVMSVAPVAIIAAMAVIPMPVVIMPVVWMPPTPSIPWSNTNEYPAHKPARTVIAIRSTSIWIVGVIAPGAVRGSVVCWNGNDRRTHADPHAYSDLSVRNQRKWQEQN